MTGAIKNLFGAADTDTRKRAHAPRTRTFLPEAIVDIFSARVPDLFVLDAVEGMEGFGPSHGRAKKVGWVAASTNGLALDYVQSVMMGFSDPFSIPLLSIASKRLEGPGKREDIELKGARWEDLPCKGFERAPSIVSNVPSLLRGAAHHVVTLKPVSYTHLHSKLKDWYEKALKQKKHPGPGKKGKPEDRESAEVEDEAGK